jgi:hypothetical protein
VVYELDQSIVLPVTPQQPIVIPDASIQSEPEQSVLEQVVDVVSGWFASDETEPVSTSTDPILDETSPAVRATPIPAAVDGVDVPELQPEPQTPPPTVDGPQAWWSPFFLSYAWAQVEDIAVATTSTEIEIQSLAATTTPEDTADADIATTTAVTATTTDGVVDEVIATSSVTTLPLVRLGTTSIERAVLEQRDDGSYAVVIPPGSLPLGIWELFIATTTSAGEVNERVVIDVGGGTVTTFQLDDRHQVLVVTREDGQTGLWLWNRTADGTAAVRNILPYGEFAFPSPLAVFDDVLFTVTAGGGSILGTDLLAGVSYSHSIERPGLAVVMPLRSGLYYVTPSDIDFQFVSVAGAVY